ncbi:AbrB/MazE/SpoVT family DNA-binding domain-containing protein [Mycobacterium sp.]|uniref:AbrB/MazE/SpoVT family DNA-binding domain-containing protein n=1 Tax=Mycobacterium sp. TaxID=1785 RepID=UPI0031DC07FD
MKTTIDKAGRVVIPKPIRDRHRLVPGTEVDVIDSGDRLEFLLPDDRDDAVLVEKGGRLVISAATGKPTTLEDMLSVRDRLRESRFP